MAEILEPASLNKRLIFCTIPAGPDGFGDSGSAPTSWVDVLTVWGSLTPVSAGESMRGAAVQQEVSHRIIVRYRSTINAKQGIKYGTRRFAITGIRNMEERNEWLEIIALEGNSVV